MDHICFLKEKLKRTGCIMSLSTEGIYAIIDIMIEPGTPQRGHFGDRIHTGILPQGTLNGVWDKLIMHPENLPSPCYDKDLLDGKHKKVLVRKE